MKTSINIFLISTLWLAAFLLNGCNLLNNKIEIKNSNVNKEETPDIVLNNYYTTSYEKERLLWELKADQAYVFEKTGITKLKMIDFKNYDAEKKTVDSSAIADRGEVENKTQNLTLLDNVEIVNSEKTIIKGDYFFWDDSSKLFTSPNRVTITKADGSTISGIGFSADQNLGDIEFKKQVSGQLSDNKENDENNFFDGF